MTDRFRPGDVVKPKQSSTPIFYQVISAHHTTGSPTWYVARIIAGGKFGDETVVYDSPYFLFVRHATLPAGLV